MKYKLSIVIPVFNEEKSIPPLFSELNKLSKKLPKSTEVILVDDGSTDQTLNKIKKLKIKYSKKIISLSRNFGHQSALIAGLRHSNGQISLTMDGDLQHPPQMIPEMVELHDQGYDIVLTQKISYQNESFLKKKTSKLFYKLINLFSSTDITDSSSDFRSLNRAALDALLSMPENKKFLRGLVSWIGYRKIILPFEVQNRVAGSSKYSIKKMMLLAASGITSFSTLPLYLAGIAGLGLTLSSLIYGVYIIYQYFAGETVTGWASMLMVTLVIGGASFLFLGIIGVYLASIYDEIKKRPIYLVKEVTNEKKS